jgi:hypothetical protein
MKPFLLFGGQVEFRNGGWGDFRGAFETPTHAQIAALANKHEWWQIVDSATLEIVKEYDEDE